ncbi:hypothetical protein Raf01_91510 [Rugosimonospora africana]|uniref:Uncharacterized protein n=1 Tax=Rugosimonospora africana TaxID=556532 RepID=A0A8J3VWI6_9ACTN|nr:hypothetical protein Raf01_91510 [Rugosimonospora africana]
MLASTRARVAAEMVRFPLSAYDTVLGATPACRATSRIVMTPLGGGRRPVTRSGGVAW